MRPSRAAVIALALALAVLAASPPGQAQQPSLSPSVSLTVDAAEGTVSVDDAASFTVTVTNTGQTTGTPLDEQNSGDVTLTVTGVPAGWTASLQPTSFRLAPGQSGTSTLQVSVAPEADGDAAQLVLTATIRSAFDRLDPVLGLIPGGTQTGSATADVQVTRDDSVTRNVLEAIGPWIYGILLVMVAALLVAVAISVSSRRSLVRLSANTRELTVAAGGRVAFPFSAEGLAKETDTVLLQVSAVQTGWAAFLPVPELQLEPGAVQELTLVVIAPHDADQGARQAVLVTATTAKAPKGSASLEFVAIVEGLTPREKTAEPAAAKKRRK